MKRAVGRGLFAGLGLVAVVVAVLLFLPREGGYDVTLFLTSDLHYGVRPTVAATNLRTVEAMNALPGAPWPEALGGGPVAVPRGVAVLGDLTENGSSPDAPAYWSDFVRDYGVAGEGRLRFPVYENAGNHDGGEDEVVRQGIRKRNEARPGLAAVSPNGINYSWDWDGVHFVSLGIFAGSAGDDIVNQWGTHFTGSWRLPGFSLEFLKDDLARSVGRSGRPVVLLQHYGWDEWGLGWWSKEERRAYAEAVAPYNVIAVFWGHTHEYQSMTWGFIPTWCVGTGQRDPEPGEFVAVRLTPGLIRVAERKAAGEWGRWTIIKGSGRKAGDRPATME